jgi:hypothetical protein
MDILRPLPVWFKLQIDHEAAEAMRNPFFSDQVCRLCFISIKMDTIAVLPL